MSKALGLAVLEENYSDNRIPVMEHIWGLSRQAIEHFTGIDVLVEKNRINEAFCQLAEIFEIDLLWGGGMPDESAQVFDWDDGQTVKRNREGLTVVQWGVFGAAHQEDGRHFVHIPLPGSVDEALDFEPLAHFPKTIAQYREEFEQKYQQMLTSNGEVCYPVPHHYTTAFHWPLAIFGFEMLCMAGLEEDRFARLMERFVEVSRRITTAWSQVANLKAFILHDDLTMTSGPIFEPNWYRRHIFIHYPTIFEPLKKAGIPIVFTSDGNCSMFGDDIFAAGADGLNFEYTVDLQRLARDYPDKILIGNMNSHILAAGPKEAIELEVTRCLNAGRTAPRFIANVGGQLTHDIPIEHLEYFLNIRRRLCAEIRAVSPRITPSMSN